MKFKFGFEIEIEDETVLEFVNNYQEDEGFASFDSLKECPDELLLKILDDDGIFEEELDYIGLGDMSIELVKE